ncbi:hypothetical protein BAZSYMB_GCONTIG00651_0 [Bathymodiolus azoricus thioautotrophic gill symbiont]|uniref:Uncharacterized protein n=1 Tax=Bathymodiolus azoricus thioautotrophic gill symbiont TaxID=235205 RepID=A0A1H6K2R0_9GAMM|nr:hypothetical protein BAZSYMB_GCONTIG00651_0 [Bathymodiolus azoricus thioautotrophic gill symbiont]
MDKTQPFECARLYVSNITRIKKLFGFLFADFFLTF